MLLVGLLGYLSIRRLHARWRGAQPPGADTGVTLRVEGMTCTHCAATVKAALEEVDQVDEAIVDLGNGIVQVRGGEIRRDLLAAAVTRAGFTPLEPRSD